MQANFDILISSYVYTSTLIFDLLSDSANDYYDSGKGLHYYLYIHLLLDYLVL